MTYVHNDVYWILESYLIWKGGDDHGKTTEAALHLFASAGHGLHPAGMCGGWDCGAYIRELTYDEYEVIRLLDHMQMTQEQCAQRMGISRPTVTRIYDEARRKMADMLVGGRALHIVGGDVYVCPAPRPECAGEEHCCHRNKDRSRGWRE